jgi:hypothetical protein
MKHICDQPGFRAGLFVVAYLTGANEPMKRGVAGVLRGVIGGPCKPLIQPVPARNFLQHRFDDRTKAKLREILSRLLLVPVERIELPTFGLQNRCSTAELNRRTPVTREFQANRKGLAFSSPPPSPN